LLVKLVYLAKRAKMIVATIDKLSVRAKTGGSSKGFVYVQSTLVTLGIKITAPSRLASLATSPLTARRRILQLLSPPSLSSLVNP
jgi:hypothetical protein